MPKTAPPSRATKPFTWPGLPDDVLDALARAEDGCDRPRRTAPVHDVQGGAGGRGRRGLGGRRLRRQQVQRRPQQLAVELGPGHGVGGGSNEELLEKIDGLEVGHARRLLRAPRSPRWMGSTRRRRNGDEEYPRAAPRQPPAGGGRRRAARARAGRRARRRTSPAANAMARAACPAIRPRLPRGTTPPCASRPSCRSRRACADIAGAVDEHPVVIVAGATGSGKTTQLPKIALAMGRGVDKLIGVTQPRRIAATSVAARVASEIGSAPGHRGRLPGPLRRPHVGRHVREVHDRRDPPRRDPRRSPPSALRHDHRRRGARAEPDHRFPARVAEAHPPRAARPQGRSSARRRSRRSASPRSSAAPPSSRCEGRTYPVDVLYEPPPRATSICPRRSPAPSRT